MDFFERYSKDIMEPFALKVLSLSFDSSYGEYYAPTNSDNFDYISLDRNSALEITSIISKNEMQVYIYEKSKAKGKQNLKHSMIRDLNLKDDGNIESYYGGSMSEIKVAIIKSIDKKQNKALKRLKEKQYNCVDLCLCINDGGLFDKYSFELAFTELDKYLFNKIFFITCTHFICYSKENGFKEYPRIITDNS